MGKNQIAVKETQSQGVCDKIFKAVNLRSFRRVSTVYSPQTQSPKSAIKPKVAATTTDHHRNDPARAATKFKIVSQTIPLVHDKNLSFDSNMVFVEYNHMGSVENAAIPKFKKESPANIVAARDHHQRNQDPKSVKSGDYYSDTSNDRFSEYIDRVKNKLKTTSSFDDDGGARRDSLNDVKVSHYIDRSKFNIRPATMVGAGNQGAA